jgi:hypothetical protein
VREKDAQIKKVEEALEELVKLKESYENALLEKFSILLNEKKLKIRDQQRLLSASNVDPDRVEAIARSRDSRSRSVGPSRPRKRKQAVKDEESDDDGFEKMAVAEEGDEPDIVNDSDGDGRRTPDSESTASEGSKDDEPVAPPSRKTAHEQDEGKVSSSAVAAAEEQDFALPPKRVLPFQQKKPIPKPAPAANGSDTESDDDEL